MGMTHKEWMRDCINQCKCKGEIITSGAAEMLLEKFAEHMDESGGGGMTVFLCGQDNEGANRLWHRTSEYLADAMVTRRELEAALCRGAVYISCVHGSNEFEPFQIVNLADSKFGEIQDFDGESYYTAEYDLSSAPV